MLFRRIACVGVMLATVAGAVLQIRLMKGAALREIHLLVGQQAKIHREIAAQSLELDQLRAPWRVADQLSSLRLDILPPASNRPSVEPKKSAGAQATEASAQADPAEVTTQTNHSGDAAKQWSSHPSHNKKTAH